MSTAHRAPLLERIRRESTEAHFRAEDPSSRDVRRTIAHCRSAVAGACQLLSSGSIHAREGIAMLELVTRELDRACIVLDQVPAAGGAP